jgi:alkylhydroperoxidase/carboxymuconolactone decarboxylase family protein YurZ
LTTAARGVAALDASFGRAIQLLDDVAGRDGALTVHHKRLLEVALAALGDPDRCEAAVERAVGSGASTAELQAVALALYLSRGERPARIVLDAVGADATADTAPGVEPVDADEIIAEFAAVFGGVPARVRLLEQHVPEGLEAYHRMRVAVLRDGPLAPLLGEFVLFAANVVEHRADFAAVHARGARRAGATEAQLVEAGLTAVRYGGVAAWLAAAEAIVETRATAGAS